MFDLHSIKPFLEASSNAYVIILADKPDFTMVEANQAFFDITGSERTKVVGRSIFSGYMLRSVEYNSKGQKVLRDCLERSLLLKRKQRCALQRYDLKTVKGFDVRFWTYETSPILDDEGHVSHLVLYVVDVTGSVLAEAEEKAIDPLIEAYPDAVASLDLNGNFLSANRAMIDLTQCAKEELLKRSFVPFIAPEDFSRVFSGFQKALLGEMPKFETHFISTRGNRYVVNCSCMPIKINQDIIGVHLVARNITNLRNAERQLEQYHQRLASIIESIRDGFFAVDRNSIVEYWNMEAERLFKKSREEVIGQNLWHALPDSFSSKFYASQQRAINERTSVRYEEFSDLLQVWLEVSIFPSPNGLSVYFKDITQRIAVEQALEASEQRFKALVQNGSDVIAIIDRKGNYLYMSPSSVSGLGVGPEFWVGKNVLEFVHPEDKERIAAILHTSHTVKQLHIPPFRFKRDGIEYRWIETVITDMTEHPSVGGLVTNTKDVTERLEYIRAIEEQNARLRDIAFIQSHIVRAPLMRIKGLADVICHYEKDPEQITMMLSLLNEAVTELDSVIQDIIGKTDNL